MEQTVALRRGSAIAQCVQGAVGQLLGDHIPGAYLIPRKFIFLRTWCRHVSAIF